MPDTDTIAPRPGAAPTPAHFDPGGAYQLSPRVGLRPEPFGALAYHFDTRRLVFLKSTDLVDVVRSLASHRQRAGGRRRRRRPRPPIRLRHRPRLARRGRRGRTPPRARPGAIRVTTLHPTPRTPPLVEQLKGGLDAPICLTWELTYACNLACVHCLSSSGRRDPRELTTAEAFSVVDQLADLQVFYVNMGGGEPMLRKDFFDIVEYSIDRNVGVKFSTNGTYLDADAARRLAGMNYLDVQISLDGMDAATNDAVRGDGSWAAARRAMDNLAAADFGEFKISIVCTRHNIDQLDDYKAMADDYGAQLRITRLRPSGRGVDSYHDLRLTNPQQRQVFHWILDHPDVLTGDSFFHLNAMADETGESLPGHEHVRRRSHRVSHRPGRRRLRLPVRDPRRVPRRQRPRRRRLRPGVAASPTLFTELRQPQSAGRLRLVRQLRCVPGRVHGHQVLHRTPARRPRPRLRLRPRRRRPGGRSVRTACPGRRRTTAGPARPCRWPSAASPEPRRPSASVRSRGTRSEKSSGTMMSAGERSAQRPLAEPEHGRVDAVAEHVEHVLDAGLTADGQRPQRGPPDHHGLGAERHRLDDVAAPPDAAVHDDLDLVADGLGHQRESPHRGRRGVEVVAAVVRHADGAEARRRPPTWRR